MTHTAKHTPGPWVVRNKDAVYAQSGRFIADCELTPYGSRPQPPNSTDEANAHLIAAAPAMYEALTHALSVCEAEAELRGENDIDDYLGGAAGPVARMIRAALAQADGKQKVS